MKAAMKERHDVIKCVVLTLAAVSVRLAAFGNAANPDSFGFATWNVGHFALGLGGRSTIDVKDVPAKAAAYRGFLSDAAVSVLGVCEHSAAFSSDGSVKAADTAFADFAACAAGPTQGAHANGVYWKDVAKFVSSGHRDYPVRNAKCYYEWVRLEIAGREVCFVETHCDWDTLAAGHESDRIEQMKHLVREFGSEPRVVIAGDFNTCRRKSANDPWRDAPDEFGVFLRAGFKAAHWGACKTWPASAPYMGIDNVFVKGLAISDVRVQSDKTLSDHCLLRCTLTFVDGCRKAPHLSDQGVVCVSSFGYDPEDSTRFIQTALDSGARTVVIDRQKGPWVACPLFARSNTEIVFEEGVELVAKRGAFRLVRGNSLFSLDGVTNVVVRGSGSGATMRMWKKDYQAVPYEHSEWRHALNILSSKDICIENLRFVASGGDGIYLGVKEAGCANTDVVIRNCVCSDNNRQGISVISAKNLLIEDVILEKTCGAAPQAGIDLEPNAANEKLANVVVRNCLSRGNAGNGFELYLNQLDDTSEPISVTFENCRSVGNRLGAAVHGGVTRTDHFVKGKIEFDGCTFENSGMFGISVTSTPASAFDVTFSDCVVTNARYDVGLGSTKLDQGFTDGVRFDNLRVHQPVARDWCLTGSALGPVPQRIEGSVVVSAPGAEDLRVTLDADWRAKKFGEPVYGGRPLPLQPPQPKPDEVTVEDACPGRRVPLAPLACVYGARFVFLMDAPGRATFVGRQLPSAVPGRPLDTRPYVIRPFGSSSVDGRKWEVSAVVGESTEFSFDAPERGFYTLEVPDGGRRFCLEESSVPIAVNVADCVQTVVALDDAGFDLSFLPTTNSPFVLIAGGSWYDKFGVEVRDPSNRLVSSSASVDGLFSVSAEGSAEKGFWKARFAGPFAGDKKVVLDLHGAQPCFFLSAAKRWR